MLPSSYLDVIVQHYPCPAHKPKLDRAVQLLLRFAFDISDRITWSDNKVEQMVAAEGLAYSHRHLLLLRGLLERGEMPIAKRCDSSRLPPKGHVEQCTSQYYQE